MMKVLLMMLMLLKIELLL
jgi:hypothetical protein